MNYNDVLHSPVVTEKSEFIKESKEKSIRYVFNVHPDANKELIRQSLYKIYKVDAIKVNIMKVQGKSKRFRQSYIKLPSWKKAIVTLKSGQSIDFLKKSE